MSERHRLARGSGLAIEADDPRADDVRALLASHLSFARSQTPPENAHALDLDELCGSAITLVSARRDGALVAIGALRELAPDHGEIKSMHTVAAARGRGVGAALLAHLLALARSRGYARVSLETGSHPSFAPARALYARAGFVVAGPFASYRASPDNVFMTLELAAGGRDR